MIIILNLIDIVYTNYKLYNNNNNNNNIIIIINFNNY